MSKQALTNVSGRWFVTDEKVIQQGLDQSRESPRRRMILPIHRRQDSPVQRMLNFLQPETYIRPHMHPREGAVESICLLQGAIRFFVFDENGTPTLSTYFEAGSPSSVIDIEPKVWHSFVVLKSDTVIFETKMGPYDENLDKTFAGWAPDEDSDEVPSWIDHHKSDIYG